MWPFGLPLPNLNLPCRPSPKSRKLSQTGEGLGEVGHTKTSQAKCYKENHKRPKNTNTTQVGSKPSTHRESPQNTHTHIAQRGETPQKIQLVQTPIRQRKVLNMWEKIKLWSHVPQNPFLDTPTEVSGNPKQRLRYWGIVTLLFGQQIDVMICFLGACRSGAQLVCP